jgi:hypothetical protein
MARKAKRKAKAAKSKKRGVRRSSKSTKRRVAKAKAKTRRARSTKSSRSRKERVPSEPAGRIGLQRPSNQPKPPGREEPRELAQAEPDARFDDRRLPEDSARDPGAESAETGRDSNYKNTDERF